MAFSFSECWHILLLLQHTFGARKLEDGTCRIVGGDGFRWVYQAADGFLSTRAIICPKGIYESFLCEL